MKKAEDFLGQQMIVLPKSVRNILHSGLFTKQLYLTDIGYYPNARRHFRERKSGSIENILILCESGKGWVEINGYGQELSENQYIIIPKNSAHKYYSDLNHPWSIYWLHFCGEMDEHFVAGCNQTMTLSKSENSRKEDRYRLFDELFIMLQEDFSKNNLEYSSILLSHLLGSLKYVSQFRKIKSYQLKDNVSLAIRFMKDNLTKKLSLAEIAEASKLSVSQISLRFKEQLNKPPLEYLTFLKIQKACQQLSLTDQKVKDIAQDLGYTDAYYFSRVFTKVMGMSPINYRKKETLGNEN